MKEKCCLCGKAIEGHAHNAQPLADGKCCEECNVKVVEARLEEFARFLEGEEDELCPNQKK